MENLHSFVKLELNEMYNKLASTPPHNDNKLNNFQTPR